MIVFLAQSAFLNAKKSFSLVISATINGAIRATLLYLQQYDYFWYSNHLTSKNGQQNKFSKRNDLNKGKKGKKIENRVRNKCKASFSFLNLQFDRLKKKWLPYIKMDTSGHNGIN